MGREEWTGLLSCSHSLAKPPSAGEATISQLDAVGPLQRRPWRKAQVGLGLWGGSLPPHQADQRGLPSGFKKSQ